MRLFYGIIPPKHILNPIYNMLKLLEPLSLIKESGIIIKPTKRQNLHFTIMFLGNFDKHKAMTALKLLSIDVFKAKLSNIGFFPNSKYIRVLWLGVEPEAPFTAIHKQLAKALELKPEPNFKPHLTIARIKKLSASTKQDLLEFKRKADKLLTKLPDFSIETIVLFNSILSEQGPYYEKLAEKDLKTSKSN